MGSFMLQRHGLFYTITACTISGMAQQYGMERYLGIHSCIYVSISKVSSLVIYAITYFTLRWHGSKFLVMAYTISGYPQLHYVSQRRHVKVWLIRYGKSLVTGMDWLWLMLHFGHVAF